MNYEQLALDWLTGDFRAKFMDARARARQAHALKIDRANKELQRVVDESEAEYNKVMQDTALQCMKQYLEQVNTPA